MGDTGAREIDEALKVLNCLINKLGKNMHVVLNSPELCKINSLCVSTYHEMDKQKWALLDASSPTSDTVK